MRSPAEIAFRLRQEVANLWLWARKPRLLAPIELKSTPLPAGPEVAGKLRNSAFARDVIDLAGRFMAHQFPVLGYEIDAGDEIDWRRDYVNGISTPLAYFRRVPYLDFSRAGDHKVIWELNRHQHLPVLAQAWLFTRDQRYLKEIQSQLESWLAANPYMEGINWASALEVAFRALSWIWVYHWAGADLDASTRLALAEGCYRHGLYLRHNLSVYFSPNTHLLGEAVALHALGTLFPEFPGAADWKELGGRLVEEQLTRQVRQDGSHFEQSTYYHVYALDLFLIHAILAGWDPKRLERMAEYLAALSGPQRILAFLGDDDGGRLFHPYGNRARFARATLATCAVLLRRGNWAFDENDLYQQAAWWTGVTSGSSSGAAPSSQLFPGAGTAVIAGGSTHIVIDGGPFGPGTAGHSHSDTLSFVVWDGGEILIDPGTFTYTSDSIERDRFRGTAAHNTIRIDGRDQATTAGAFRWLDPPVTRIISFERDSFEGECAYSGFVHRRRVELRVREIVVLDVIDGRGEHLIEQFWHMGPDIDTETVKLDPALHAEVDDGWRSRAFGHKENARVIRGHAHLTLPATLTSSIRLDIRPVH